MQICTSLQTENHASTLFFTGRMPFLPPNQQRQSTEGKSRYLSLQLLLYGWQWFCLRVVPLWVWAMCRCTHQYLCIVLCQIGNVLDSYAATLTKRGDHDVFYMTTQGISQLVQRSVLPLEPVRCRLCTDSQKSTEIPFWFSKPQKSWNCKSNTCLSSSSSSAYF